jgi:3-oxoacyl-[acyl-carrier-protein] synthase III
MTHNEVTCLATIAVLCKAHRRSVRTIRNALEYGDRDMCRQFSDVAGVLVLHRIRAQTALDFQKKKGQQ